MWSHNALNLTSKKFNNGQHWFMFTPPLYFTWCPSPLGITWTSTIPCWQALSSMHLLQLSYWKYPNNLIDGNRCNIWWHFNNIGNKNLLSLSSTTALPYSWPIKENTRWRVICLGSKIIDIMLWVFLFSCLFKNVRKKSNTSHTSFFNVGYK